MMIDQGKFQTIKIMTMQSIVFISVIEYDLIYFSYEITKSKHRRYIRTSSYEIKEYECDKNKGSVEIGVK